MCSAADEMPVPGLSHDPAVLRAELERASAAGDWAPRSSPSPRLVAGEPAEASPRGPVMRAAWTRGLAEDPER